MSRYKKFVCLIIIIEIALVAFCNGLYLYLINSDSARLYRVEANRVALDIEELQLSKEEVAQMDLSEYETIVGVNEFMPDEVCNNDYVVEEIDGKLYRIEYRVTKSYETLFYINCALIGMIFMTVMVLLYIHKKVLMPFHAMSSLSYELAKGNLSNPVKEEKSKLFGRFLWGMDMLREKLEDNREKELEFQKERK